MANVTMTFSVGVDSLYEDQVLQYFLKSRNKSYTCVTSTDLNAVSVEVSSFIINGFTAYASKVGVISAVVAASGLVSAASFN